MTDIAVELKDVTKHFGDVVAVDNISFQRTGARSRHSSGLAKAIAN